MKKKILYFASMLSIMVCLFVLSPKTASALNIYYSGTDDGLTYSFNLSSGTLTISGTGELGDGLDWFSGMWDMNGWVGNTYYDYTEIDDRIKTVVIKSGVTGIGDYAFRFCSNLTSVTVPDTVTRIGDYAFYGTKITSFKMPAYVTSIGDYAFADCESLTGTVAIRATCKSVGKYAFENCTNLTTVSIKSGAQALGDYCFYNCTSLTSVTIPGTCKTVGMYAFAYCDNITTAEFKSGVQSIGSCAFEGCYKLSSITIADSVTYIGTSIVDSISAYAKNSANWDNNCLYIGNHLIRGSHPNWTDDDFFTEFTVRDGTLTIAGCAFTSQWELTKVTIPDSVKNICYSAFLFCTELTEVEFPEGITVINNGTFNGCTSLKSFKIPSTVTKIDDRAFIDCQGLESIDIPDSVSVIGERAFENCYALNEIELPTNLAVINANTFYGCRNLTEITIPEICQSIGESAFSGCRSLTEINIPNNVQSIGKSAFRYNRNLTKVTIGAGLSKLGSDAFYPCPALETVTVNKTNTAFCAEDGILFNKDKTTLVLYPAAKTAAHYTVEEGITAIGLHSFSYAANLVSVMLPKSLTSCNKLAFDECTAFTDIYYAGSEEEWNGLKFYTNSAYATSEYYYFENATKHFNYVILESIEAEETEVFVEEGGETKINVVITPENASDATLIWTSSDESIATVDEDGTVTAVSTGTVTITAATEDGKFSTSCEVTVYAEPEITDISVMDMSPYGVPLLAVELKMNNPVSSSDIFVASYDENGKMLDVKTLTADSLKTNLSSDGVDNIRAFVWGNMRSLCDDYTLLSSDF
ncbi:MAG: leucine-rich repeat protein [Clostridia bacterium]|nr:leucine-rich repeat protein [Clostridia bacterium]